MPNDEQKNWSEYRERELLRLTPLLETLGFVLDAQQPHTRGERALTRPLSSGRKALLLGCRKADNRRVVIKASNEPKGIEEIERERTCRDVLEHIGFAYAVFSSPEELLFTKTQGYTILVTGYIEQERAFLERPLEEQFALALRAFKAQESAHASTYRHVRVIQNTFGEMRASDYLQKYASYIQEIAEAGRTIPVLERAKKYLTGHQEVIEQYAGFLTHWDFMPQNIRVADDTIYLLDHSSLHFGNKYEGWARFINFMTLYNPPLAEALVQYVRDNRTSEESLSLKCMRLYRLGELIRYYVGWLPRTSGALHELAKARIVFWSKVLEAVLEEKEVAAEVIETYKHTRDSLRSEEEKQRQIGLH